jgi:hypothetical protein
MIGSQNSNIRTRQNVKPLRFRSGRASASQAL